MGPASEVSLCSLVVVVLWRLELKTRRSQQNKKRHFSRETSRIEWEGLTDKGGVRWGFHGSRKSLDPRLACRVPSLCSSGGVVRGEQQSFQKVCLSPPSVRGVMHMYTL